MVRFQVGDVRLTVLEASTFRLDGGAMFGVVPRPLWSRVAEADERNRIAMVARVLVIEHGDGITLVDTGAGLKHDRKFVEIHALAARSIVETLESAGVDPGRVDRVVNTHLHFDHAGGNTEVGDDGRPRAALPGAEYLIQEAELAIARRRDNERLRAAYDDADFEPLAAEGRLRAVRGDVDLGHGVALRLSPGHTPGMQIVTVSSGGETVAFLADLVPMVPHVSPAWTMAYDFEPLVTMASKKAVLGRAFEERWKLVLQHDPERAVVTLVEREGKLRARPWEPGD